jgi:hypothetical protein
MRPLANPFMKFMLATMSLVVLAAPVRAQEIENPYAPKATERAKTQPNSVSYARMHDARGLNVFETPKVEGVPYDGFKMQWGAAFTQQFQSLKHENSQAPIPTADTLIKIGSGFNNAEANLYMDAQLARGMRVALTSYLSSRHHNETWVKDGYLLIDGSPWENETLDKVMEYVTLRLGHMEINYGDMHFRRTDNGSAMFNPLVGNLLMDAFTTEVGGEVYVRKGEYMGMVAVTGGEVRGQVIKPENRSPAVIAKVGYDKTFEPGTRFRITGSLYNTSKSNNNTLFSGNRSGSRYYYVLENKGATETAQAWSGDVRPGMTRKVQAWVINPFVTYKGLELFGNYEQAKGRTLTETADRKVTQWAAEGVYRFLNNNLYVAGRYNQVKGRVQDASGTPTAADVTVNRTQVGGGWFLTQTALAKLEYVKQEHRDYPLASRFAEGNFHGVMFEAVVSF